MGIYSDYLNRALTGDQLQEERKKMLREISQIRGRDLLVYAADVMKGQQGAPIALGYDDLLPVTDQLANLSGTAIDVILETGGGSGEIAEDIVRILRSKYTSVAFIVPGIAKSAGTIMVMSGDEILMDHMSALGPIDAQIQFEGKQFSAEALLKGFEKIKDETDRTKSLNRAYIPLLQRISPGDLQHAQNALDFARVLVADWLAQFKFQNWNQHRTHSPGTPVTDAEKKQRADEVAAALCDHSRWLTHGRSLRMEDLRGLGLEITDLRLNPDLFDRVRRYHVLLQMMLNSSPIYKIIETPGTQIVRLIQPVVAAMPFGPTPQGGGQQGSGPTPGQPGMVPGQLLQADGILAEVECNKCKTVHKVQVDFGTLKPLQPGMVGFPSNDVMVCRCGNQLNLLAMRQQLEMQARRPVAKS